ncbi:MAG: hypothetical protein ACYTXI_32615 [Nostoc sp.]
MRFGKLGIGTAHPNKYKVTGEIVNVEPEEADWLLEVLELLFDVTAVETQEDTGEKRQTEEKIVSTWKTSN